LPGRAIGGGFLAIAIDVAEEIHVLQPNDFCAAEKRQRLQRIDRGANSCGGLFGVVCGAIDRFQSKVTCA